VKAAFTTLLRPYQDRAVLMMTLLGFASGLPLLLTGSTLSFWLKQLGLSYTSIGLFSLATLPYSIKFLWAPLVDKMKIPYLSNKIGLRRSWLLTSQLFLCFSLLGLGSLDIINHLSTAVFLVMCIAFFSATQDIVMLAYQVERLGERQYGPAEGLGVLGYRLGMLMAGAGALYLNHSLDMSVVYILMGIILSIGMVTVFLIDEPKFERPTFSTYNKMSKATRNSSLARRIHCILQSFNYAAIAPFKDFMKREGWYYSLLIMFFYKIGDNFIGNMHTNFYAELGFSNIEIANATKIFGTWASVLGGLVGGIIVARQGIMKSLFYCGIIHAIAMLMYIIMYRSGHDNTILYVSVASENITGGMRLTALFSYQMRLCNKFHAATQLAILTSCVNMGRTFCASTSGWIIENLGWENLFWISIFSMVPVLFIILHQSAKEREPIFSNRLIYLKN
jgi:PAT family beta-lactamase induction signal transducer AmpG